MSSSVMLTLAWVNILLFVQVLATGWRRRMNRPARTGRARTSPARSGPGRPVRCPASELPGDLAVEDELTRLLLARELDACTYRFLIEALAEYGGSSRLDNP